MFGPIFNLKFFGLFCPCFEKEEDRAARLSLNQLNELGRRVDWHTKSGTLEKGKGLVSKMFGRQHTDKKPPTPARLICKDTSKENINYGDFFPQLQLEPMKKQSTESNNSGFLQQQTSNYRLDIPLHHICRIDSVDATMIVIITKDVHTIDEDNETKEAARLSWQSSEDRDKVCVDLKVLVEWNKNRQPEVEEEFAADGIRARAKKAAHFAKREMEMRETKNSREKRKQKYLNGGGMKFTAIAMANREIS